MRQGGPNPYMSGLKAFLTRYTLAVPKPALLDGNLHSLNGQSSPQTRAPVPALPWQWAFHMLPRVVIAGSPISSATCMDCQFLDKTNSGFGVLPCCQPFQSPSSWSRPVSPAVLLCGPTPLVSSEPHCCDGLPRPSTAIQHSPAS